MKSRWNVGVILSLMLLLAACGTAAKDEAESSGLVTGSEKETPSAVETQSGFTEKETERNTEAVSQRATEYESETEESVEAQEMTATGIYAISSLDGYPKDVGETLSVSFPLPEGWKIDESGKTFFSITPGLKFGRAILNADGEVVGAVGYCRMKLEELIGEDLSGHASSEVFAGFGTNRFQAFEVQEGAGYEKVFYENGVLAATTVVWHDYTANERKKDPAKVPYENRGILIADSQSGAVIGIEIDRSRICPEDLRTMAEGILVTR